MISRSQKEAMLTEIQSRVSHSDAVLLTDFGGLDVSQITALRRNLRAAGGGYSVIKNRIFLKALEGEGYSEYAPLRDFFKGSIGVAYLSGDVGAGAKVLKNYASDEEKFEIRAGFFDGNLLSAEDVEAIASLPSKEVLLGKVLSSIVGVHRGLLFTLSGTSRNLVSVLSAIKDKKTQAE